LIRRLWSRQTVDQPALDFLPDADEIERRPLPRSASFTLHLLALALLVFLLLATFSDIDLVITARGRLITPLPNIVLQPLDTAIIQQINVKPGQIVKKGEQLATLDPTFTEADETQLRTRLGSLDNERARLEAELSGKTVTTDAMASDDKKIQGRLADERQASYLAQMRRLDENIARIRASLETNRRDQTAMNSRVQVLREMVAMLEPLVAQQYAVRARLLDAQDRLLEAERGAQMARSREQELQKERTGLEAERLSFQTGWRQKIMEELLALSRERDSVNEQLQKADKRHQLVILTAPSDAVVLEIAKLSAGSVARAAEVVAKFSQHLHIHFIGKRLTIHQHAITIEDDKIKGGCIHRRAIIQQTMSKAPALTVQHDQDRRSTTCPGSDAPTQQQRFGCPPPSPRGYRSTNRPP